jgi:hypothetical protein
MTKIDDEWGARDMADRASVESRSAGAVPPPMLRSIVQAFRQARLARLEARVQRLRQRAGSTLVMCEPSVMYVAATRISPQADAECRLLPPTQPPRRWLIGVTVGLLLLTGVSLGVKPFWSRFVSADAMPTPTEPLPTSTARETEELHILLRSVGDRVSMLQHQAAQHAEQLSNHAATVTSVSQLTNTQETYLTALTDAVGAMTAQIAHLERQMTAPSALQLAQVQAPARQSAALETLTQPARNPRRATPVVQRHVSRPHPPTLEVFAPPPVLPVTPVPGPSPRTPTGETSSPRRPITLPAALGIVGFGGPNTTTGGSQP